METVEPLLKTVKKEVTRTRHLHASVRDTVIRASTARERAAATCLLSRKTVARSKAIRAALREFRDRTDKP